MNDGRIKLLSQASQLAPYLDSWRSWAPSPMQSPEWLLAWWSAFQTPACRLTVLVILGQDGTPIGLAPFYLRDSWGLGRSLRFLGSGRACSDFQTLLAAPGQAALVAQTVANWLLAGTAGFKWSFLELEGTTQDDPAISSLIAPMLQGNCIHQATELEHTWRLDLSGGWAGFMARLSRTQRSQTSNLVNRFDKNASLTLRTASGMESIEQALAHCIALHQLRWQTAGKPGCFADPRFTDFVTNATRALAERSQLKFLLLEDQGIPIVCHLYLLGDSNKLYMYQSGRDPSRDKNKVGRMLNALSIRLACEQGVEFIDFLRGDEIYKGRLGAVPNKCLRTRFVAPATLPRLRHGLWMIGRGVRSRVKAIGKQKATTQR